MSEARPTNPLVEQFRRGGVARDLRQHLLDVDLLLSLLRLRGCDAALLLLAAELRLLALLERRSARHAGRDLGAVARTRILAAEDGALDLVEQTHGLDLQTVLDVADAVVAELIAYLREVRG